MTPEALAAQQLWAAWISAGAACVQAIGAVGAIAISIKLARDSAHREVEAQERSRAREAAAETASIAREQSADQAAIKRAQELLKSERNALIIPVMAAAEKARQSLIQEAGVARQANYNPNIVGPLTNQSTSTLLSAIQDTRLLVKDSEVILTYGGIQETLSSVSQPGTYSYDDFLNGKRELAEKIEKFMDALEVCCTKPVFRS